MSPYFDPIDLDPARIKRELHDPVRVGEVACMLRERVTAPFVGSRYEGGDREIRLGPIHSYGGGFERATAKFILIDEDDQEHEVTIQNRVRGRGR